ncbi:O-antigen ligase family protein [Dactylosporangium sp. NPDC048998]|uniref:O-antigen ligase family protein n=1 Tax=Dactylosporangium sp. NPDC048998 TaxID=3363976 RepID=UPI0037142FA3
MTGPKARVAGAVAAIVIALLAGVLEYTRTDSIGQSAAAFAAGLIAMAVVGLALSLPGITLQGLGLGGLFVLAGILTWTATKRPGIIWAVLAVEVVVFAVWAWPWLRSARSLSRLGTAWLGLAYWFFGILGAVFVERAGHFKVAGQRVAYAGVFTLAVLALIALNTTAKRRGRDLSVGMAAAILLGIAALLLVGSGSLFDKVHAVPDNASAHLMTDRFWGGPGLFYHPNSLAGLMAVAGIRIGFDRAMAAWQRLGVAALAALVLSISDSRTGFVFAAAAAVLHLGLVLWRRNDDVDRLPSRSAWLSVVTPFVVLLIVVTLGNGYQFLLRDRFNNQGDDVTSGRTDTWRQVWVDWKHAGWAEKAFGDARTSRAVVERVNDGNPIEGPRRQLNTDNAAVGAFRRGGVLGAAAFVLGLGLLLWHALRRRRDGTLPAAWFTIGALAVVPTIATEDWLIGGTNGAIWLLLAAGEARTLLHRDEPSEVAPAPEPAVA